MRRSVWYVSCPWLLLYRTLVLLSRKRRPLAKLTGDMTFWCYESQSIIPTVTKDPNRILQPMDKLNEMTQIGLEVLSILERLSSGNSVTVRTARDDHLKLMDRFYRENYDIITSPQYETARKDVTYFLRLVYQALEYHGVDVCTG